MIDKPGQPFGKRGRLPAPARAVSARPALSNAPAAVELPADLLAAIVRPGARDEPVRANAGKILVARSLRAALLAGLCVGFFSVAMNAAARPSLALTALSAQLGPLLGQSLLPLPALSIVLGLWSGARTSMISLLLMQRLLNHFGLTQHFAYALGGGGASVAYSALIHAAGLGLAQQNFGLEFLTGLGAGFFYRLFAGTVQDPAPALMPANQA